MALPVEKKKRVLSPAEMCVLLYGRPKVGKSSLAACFGDSVLFLNLEKGLHGLEVFQVEIKTWEDFMQAVRDLCAGGHSFNQVVIDTVDLCRDLALAHVERTENISADRPSQSVRAYGKANKLVIEALKALALCPGLGILMISHEKTQLIDEQGNILGAFDKAPGKVREKVFPNISGRPREYVLGAADLILRYTIDPRTGRRVIQTKATANVEAGERFGILPATIDAGGSAKEAHAALLAPFREEWKKENPED